jgi:hypothetical protein
LIVSRCMVQLWKLCNMCCSFMAIVVKWACLSVRLYVHFLYCLYLQVDFEKMQMTKPFYGDLRRRYYPGLLLQYRKSEQQSYLHSKLHRIQVWVSICDPQLSERIVVNKHSSIKIWCQSLWSMHIYSYWGFMLKKVGLGHIFLSTLHLFPYQLLFHHCSIFISVHLLLILCHLATNSMTK